MKYRRMRHKVEIQEVTETANVHGEMVQTWAKYVDTWADVKPMTGREFFQAQQEQYEQSVRVFTRYSDKLDGINPQKYRMVYRSKTYDILGIMIKDLKNKDMELICKVHNG